MTYNLTDIDVYHGYHGGVFRLQRGGNTYVDGVVEGKQINLVKVSGGLTVRNVLDNNDINITAVCVNISRDGDNDINIDWTIRPVFWHFLLKDRMLRHTNTDTAARTLMRVCYKSYKIGIPCDCSGLIPYDGVLYKSHKKKIDAMGAWVSGPTSPIKHLELKVMSMLFCR